MARMVVDVLGLGKVTGIAVSGDSAVAYSQSFPLPSGSPSFSFEYRAKSEGNVAVKCELEQGNQLPGVEGSADANWVVPDGALELDNSLVDEITHIKAYEPAATAFGRLKLSGLTGNDVSTVLDKLKISYIK